MNAEYVREFPSLRQSMRFGLRRGTGYLSSINDERRRRYLPSVLLSARRFIDIDAALISFRVITSRFIHAGANGQDGDRFDEIRNDL